MKKDWDLKLDGGFPEIQVGRVGFITINCGPDSIPIAKLIVLAPELLILVQKINAHLVRPECLGDLIDEAEKILEKIEAK